MADDALFRNAEVDVFPAFFALVLLQRSEILLNQWLEGVLVDVSNEVECEVVRIGEAVFIEFHCLGVVDVVDIGGFHSHAERMVAVQHHNQ